MRKAKFLMGLKLLSWIGLIVLFIVVSIAAMQKRENVKCDRVLIRFKNDKNLGFIRSTDIVKEIHNGNPSWSGQKVSQIKFNLLEKAVKQNEYVKRAEFYLDNDDQINVLVEPKNPLARVNTKQGAYYLSESWDRMSLNENYSKRIVHISGRTEQLLNPKTKIDSFVIKETKMLLAYMKKNEVWTDAIDQIYITPYARIELILNFCQPIVQIGFVDENFEKRMEKVDNFFQIAPRHQNLSVYSELDFQYSNQVIGRKTQ